MTTTRTTGSADKYPGTISHSRRNGERTLPARLTQREFEHGMPPRSERRYCSTAGVAIEPAVCSQAVAQKIRRCRWPANLTTFTRKEQLPP